MPTRTYQKALRERVIKEFIEENDRTPSDLELRIAMVKANRELPALEEVGFAGHLITKPAFGSVSSAEDENANRHAIHDDVRLASQRIDSLVNRLERSFRSFYATSRNIKRNLDAIEARVDNILLLSGSQDIFVYGIEENFVVQDKVDFDRTNASVESGFVTLGRAGFGLVDLDSVQFTHTTTAEKGYIGYQNTSPMDSLGADDGSFWEHLVYTSYKQGRVSLLLDMTLNEPQYISEMRFTTNTLGINSPMKATVFYSLDEKTFKAVKPQEVVLTKEENVFNIGLDGVKTIRLMLSKDTFDNTTAVNNQFVYLFSLDSIKLYSKSYSSDGQSTFISGPYPIVDELGNPVSFTKATCEICITQGDEDSVGMFLSTDGETFKAVDHTGNGLAVASFENGAGDGSEVVLDDSVAAGLLTDEPLVSLKTSEALVNTGVDEGFARRCVQKSIVIKRNVVSTDESTGDRILVYGVPSGWSYDDAKKLYRTTVYTTNLVSIDLGNTSAYVNGIQVSGEVMLQPGYSVFETSETNWQVVPNGLTKISDLKKRDPLYPYNHKYLIEGYVYSDTFKGEKIYAGVEEYFGELLEYTPPEVFSSPESDQDMTIYTIEDETGDLIFKVKVDKTDPSWSNECYEPSWLVSRGDNNEIWIKMVLESSSGVTSPIVSSIKVRVV